MVVDRVRRTPSTLFEMIIDQRDDLIEAWMKLVREDQRIPSSDNLTSANLRDHFPQLLNQIVLAMAKRQAGLAKTSEAAQAVGRSDAAQQHVSMRFLSGYTLVETLRELSHLRGEIVRRWVRANLQPVPNELEILHAAFDEVMTVTADEIHTRTNAAKDIFQARLSHELSTPATAIVGCVETLRNEEKSSERFQKAIDVLHRNSELLVSTVENLRDFSQIIFGRINLAVRDCDANEIAKLAAETVHASSVEKGVEITLKLERKPRIFPADPVKLHQALLNVLVNAVKFTPSAGSIEIECRSNDESVVFTVRDTGEGIAPDFLPFVFDQFRQEATADRTRGLGIGLAIAREIVEAHGGRINASSPGKGQGSTIEITIPVGPPGH